MLNLRLPCACRAALWCSAVAFVGLAGLPAIGQTEAERAPLAGPAVAARAERATLVEHDFPGKVRRLESAPEEAAARLLELTTEVREKVEAIFADRVKKLDAFVADNLLLLNQLDTAGKAGDKLDQLKLLAEAVHKLAPVWTKGTLRSQVRSVLPESARAEFDRLLAEYWDAIVTERRDEAKVNAAPARDDMKMADSKKAEGASDRAAKVKSKSRFEILTEERLASFGKEIERSFQRQLQSGDVIADYIINYVTMSDEQKARIRELCNEFAEKTKMNASEQQNRELFVKIAGVLDTKQQMELAKLIQGKKKADEGKK